MNLAISLCKTMINEAKKTGALQSRPLSLPTRLLTPAIGDVVESSDGLLFDVLGWAYAKCFFLKRIS
jgi:hypothetical protein